MLVNLQQKYLIICFYSFFVLSNISFLSADKTNDEIQEKIKVKHLINFDWFNTDLPNSWPKNSDIPNDEQMGNLKKSIEICNLFMDKKYNYLTDKSNWIKPKNEHKYNLDSVEDLGGRLERFNFKTHVVKNALLPFVDWMLIPKDSTIYVHGDFHGGGDALMQIFSRYIELGIIDRETLKIKGGNYLIFLGDYVDRGNKSLEILLFLFYLKSINFDQLILLRGNHEDFSICSRDGFYKKMLKQDKKTIDGELITKLKNFDKKDIQELTNLIFKSFEMMPVAAFLGDRLTNKFILFCHGSLSDLYTPDENTLKTLFTKPDCTLLHEIVSNKILYNFLWDDIRSLKESPKKNGFRSDVRGKGTFEYNTRWLKRMLKNFFQDDSYSINCVFKGHLHLQPYIYNEIKGNTKSMGAAFLDDIVVTVLSGYDPLYYFPTYVKVIPPNTNNSNDCIVNGYFFSDGYWNEADIKLYANAKYRKTLPIYNKFRLIFDRIEKLTLNRPLDLISLFKILMEYEQFYFLKDLSPLTSSWEEIDNSIQPLLTHLGKNYAKINPSVVDLASKIGKKIKFAIETIGTIEPIAQLKLFISSIIKNIKCVSELLVKKGWFFSYYVIDESNTEKIIELTHSLEDIFESFVIYINEHVDEKDYIKIFLYFLNEVLNILENEKTNISRRNIKNKYYLLWTDKIDDMIVWTRDGKKKLESQIISG